MLFNLIFWTNHRRNERIGADNAAVSATRTATLIELGQLNAFYLALDTMKEIPTNLLALSMTLFFNSQVKTGVENRG
jgi:hypothetical protein